VTPFLRPARRAWLAPIRFANYAQQRVNTGVRAYANIIGNMIYRADAGQNQSLPARVYYSRRRYFFDKNKKYLQDFKNLWYQPGYFFVWKCRVSISASRPRIMRGSQYRTAQLRAVCAYGRGIVAPAWERGRPRPHIKIKMRAMPAFKRPAWERGHPVRISS